MSLASLLGPRRYAAVWIDEEDSREYMMSLVPSDRGVIQRIADRAADDLFGAGRVGMMIVRPVVA